MVIILFFDRTLSEERITMVSFYKSPEIIFDERKWIEVFNKIKEATNCSQIIMLSDFNVQHEGSTRNNTSRNSFNNLTQSSYMFLNDGSGTRTSANIDYVSIHDLSIVKSFDLESLESWRKSLKQ